LLIAIPKEHRVAVIDVHSMQVARSIAVPASPQETLVRPDGAEAYVSCDVSKQVAVINLKDWTISKVINAGAVADGLAWANAQ
jgi:DNA-binding beta-propeller fold protein YncE